MRLTISSKGSQRCRAASPELGVRQTRNGYMIFTIKVTLNSWSGIIELDDSSTTEDLHYIIQQAVEFDDDHLYEFFLANSNRSHNRDTVSTYEDADTIILANIFPLAKGKKFFYLFDYGDNWVFQISRSRKAPFVPVSGTRYPRLVSETGEIPEQYPDWEE